MEYSFSSERNEQDIEMTNKGKKEYKGRYM